MARTATKEKELEIPITAPNADIHNLVVTLAATKNPDQLPQGAKTADQADAYVRPWLEQGFMVKSAQVVQAGDVNGIFTLQIYYCLIKE